MPYKPKKPCGHPGCPQLTDRDYCPEHEAQHRKEYNRYRRGYDSSARYNSEWRKIRKRYASEHPLCEKCLEQGKYVPVQEVHHILPKSEGGSNDFENLMSLCRSCHNKIHIERGDR